MTAQGISLGATVLLILPMVYFTISSLTFFLKRLDDPVVGWMLRGLFSVYFKAVIAGCVLAVIAFAAAGRPAVAAGLAALLAADVAARAWFLRRMDEEIRVRDAGDALAPRRMRRVHLGGIAWNGLQLVAVAAAVPRLFPGV
ncbi:hypothetical protein [Falsiroseomonas sp. HW251]|uniref:hypothetical protein n=1 Tax=Falsiroseomonas sp. HW251 TaxID=3390998 RepID=UPI003D3142EE